MAVGSKVSGIANIANGASLTIQPPSGQEWTIHNIWYAGAVTVNFTNGTQSVAGPTDTSAGAMLGYVFNLNNTNYITVTNTSGVAMNIAYDGVQTT